MRRSIGLPLYTCAEKIDLSEYGILHGACIDKERIRKLIGYKLDLKKDSGQRRSADAQKALTLASMIPASMVVSYCYANGRKREHGA